MKRTAAITSIRVGDILHLTVPDNRYLQSGVYAATVTLAAKRKHDWYYHCRVQLATDIYVAFQVTIPRKPHHGLVGCAFLGCDTFPVQYIHEQNLPKRINDSLPPKERLPYADN